MSGSASRMDAIKAVTAIKPVGKAFSFDKTHTGEVFGENVFSGSVMKQLLPKAVYKSLIKTVEEGRRLDTEMADVVAAAMAGWAMQKGATHYAHVFFPLTGYTAEKHDSFMVPDGDGGAIAEFSGEMLIQGEPDASSFPNGGIRQTFEARGYTAWDVTSPAYILENPNGATLCIPTAFVSWTGEALDKKTPVLRSMKALDCAARRMLNLFGTEAKSFINATAGAEQEYFLIDSNFYYARPDLVTAGRTLFGAPSPKGQEFDDHYFGAIPERVLAYMLDTERELYKLGIPVKTRHNEVAPGQYEIAPIFETANIATDHQQLVMIVLEKIAKKYGMECIMHEKPFAGLNGSGKHLNWAMGSKEVGNLLDPGDTPHDNAQFLVFCAATIKAVYKHAELLRAVIASASNDHRLGANEAPPAIISIFLGEQLTDVFEQIMQGKAKSSKQAGTLKIGVDSMPSLPKHAGDRNRTSPFAFTGNRFEFRAVGSKQSLAGPLVAINTAMAEALDDMADDIESRMKGDPKKFNAAMTAAIKSAMKEAWPIVFDGDGYSDDWHAEAEKRGLPNIRTTPDALAAITSKSTVALLKKYKVLTKRELESREETYLEQYILNLNVESRLTRRISKTMIFPAAIRYQSELARTCADLKEVGYDFDTDTLDHVTGLVSQLQSAIVALEETMAKDTFRSTLAHAKHCCDTVKPAMDAVRAVADQLEMVVADDLWPLPTYQEMLFIK